MKGRVLIIDSDREHCEALSDCMKASDYEVRSLLPGPSVIEIAESFAPTAIVIDPATEGYDPFELLRELRILQPHTPVILTARNSSVELALRAIQEEGAYHYFEKPVDTEKFLTVLEGAVELAEARRENEILRRQLRDRGAFGELIGNSEEMQRVYVLIEQVASSSASVLITGESGTGKELVARTVHNLSPRRNAPFLAINCSAIPDTLMESELFGHEKGAFTGAVSRRHGCFELANTGTLLLDEIGEMPTLLQAKLLRVLEERVVHRLGSRKDVPVDVRLLAATNKEPHGAVRDGMLREDLLYRLNVISIHLPKLAERLEDLPLLTQHLITRLAQKHNRPARFISPAALDALRFHSWPGNVRELRNVIERAVVICSGEQIERHHFAPYPFDQRQRLRSEDTVTFPVGTPLREIERQMILRTLDKTGNNKTRAAQMLSISLKTLHNKLNDYRARGLLGDRDYGNDSRVLLFFIDGLGIGTRGPHNPLDGLTDAAPLAVFQNETPQVPFAGIVVPTDACLGIDGRPQSASGQTTILTGVNAPQIIGAHKQGFPNPPLLAIIREHSIFLQLKNKGIGSITFANTYTGKFFERRPRWISATTAAVEAAGLRFNVVEDLRAGRAVYHDFTNTMLSERGETADLRSPEEAGRVLAEIASSHRFTLYEYFITDKIGHAQDHAEARRVLPMLAQFIRTLLANLDLKNTTVILTSDHGNIEDLSARNHTLNPVPTIAWGRNQEMIASRISSLVDITPAIVGALTAS